MYGAPAGAPHFKPPTCQHEVVIAPKSIVKYSLLIFL